MRRVEVSGATRKEVARGGRVRPQTEPRWSCVDSRILLTVNNVCTQLAINETVTK